MKAVIAWWDPPCDVEALRSSLDEEAWASTPGLVAKFWISDADGRWGAVMVFASEDAARQVLPPNRAAELIGRPATVRLAFDVEALVTAREGGPAWL